MKAAFTLVSVDGETVVIRDRCNDMGTMTVTNDAEAVVANLHRQYPGRRIFYYDTDGRRDELLHDKGAFRGFCSGAA